MPEMSDTEVICGWMEPKPTQVIPVGEINDSRWWWRSYPGATELVPRNLDLDALREVQSRLTEKQWTHYGALCWKWFTEASTANDYEISHLNRWRKALLHLSAEQKITALAAVLREGKTK